MAIESLLQVLNSAMRTWKQPKTIRKWCGCVPSKLYLQSRQWADSGLCTGFANPWCKATELPMVEGQVSRKNSWKKLFFRRRGYFKPSEDLSGIVQSLSIFLKITCSCVRSFIYSVCKPLIEPTLFPSVGSAVRTALPIAWGQWQQLLSPVMLTLCPC